MISFGEIFKAYAEERMKRNNFSEEQIVTTLKRVDGGDYVGFNCLPAAAIKPHSVQLDVL